MNANAPAPTSRLCPICGRPATPTYRPFCTRRCADVDLNRWLSGAYAIPVAESAAAPDDAPEDQP
jgi:endogenous inhibitor of DNA gyrase (YacG/DUF329 family)